MNRFKFRTWDNVHGSLGSRMVYHGKGCNLVTLADFWRWIGNHEPMPVMQFTGLHDRNRRGIYEGDVVRNYAMEKLYPSGDNLRFEVIFKDGSFQFESRVRASGTPDYSRKVSHRCNPCEMVRPVNWEVIGNIYENPELLEPLP